MNTLFAFIVLTSINNASVVQTVKAAHPSPPPVFQSVPKPPDGLTLYNASGDVIARCGRREDSFSDCKMEPGVTLDDLMNAWVHAYQDLSK
jgi:hypothetical protein